MCDSWTADDEKALIELQRRREEVMSKRQNVLKAIVEKIDFDPKGNGYVGTEQITDGLIHHADAITEALKPFTRKEGHRAKNVEVSSDQN